MAENSQVRSFRDVPALPGVRRVYRVKREPGNYLDYMIAPDDWPVQIDRSKAEVIETDSPAILRSTSTVKNGSTQNETTLEFQTRDEIGNDDLIVVETYEGEIRAVNWHDVHRGSMTIETENNFSGGTVNRRTVKLASPTVMRRAVFFEDNE